MRQAVILAAGKGQRLRPFTFNRPKVMLPVGGKPMMQYAIEALAQIGIHHIVVVVGYRKEQILSWLGTGEKLGVDITYVTQKKQLGTAHALAQTKAVTETEFLVLPGDNLIEADTIARLVTAVPQTILVKTVNDPTRYGVVTVKDGMVKTIIEKPKIAKDNIVNTGIYAFNKDIFDFIEDELDIPDVLNAMLAQGYNIDALETTGTWLDIVYPWDVLSLNDVVLHKIPVKLGGTIEPNVSLNGQVSVGNSTVIRSNSYIAGPTVIGDYCEIGPNACLMPATSIGDNTIVSSFTLIKSSVIGNDVNIGPGSVIQNSVIDKGCVIQGRFTACSDHVEVKINDEHYPVDVGAMLGENCKLGINVVASPGVIVGNYSRIKDLKLISGRFPDKSLVY